ncbi:MAG: hypothetical protein HAW63_02955 [Bdellovibrionaceae bacterium]|nr:hypothetical protein [Pseudobdellovibrionaceae bacterium]
MKYIFISLLVWLISINSYSKGLDLDISGDYTLVTYSGVPNEGDSSRSIIIEHAFTLRPSWLILDHWSLHSRLDFLSSQAQTEDGTINLRKNWKSGIAKVNDTFLSQLYLKYNYKYHGGHVGIKPLSFGLGITHNDDLTVPVANQVVDNSHPSLAYWFKLGSIKVETWHIYFKKNKLADKDTSYKAASSFKILYGGEDWALNYLYYKDLKFSAHNVFANKKTPWANTALELVFSSPLQGEDYTRSAALLTVDWNFNLAKNILQINNSFLYASGDVNSTNNIDESYSFSANKFSRDLFLRYSGNGKITNTMATSMKVSTSFLQNFVGSVSLLYAKAIQAEGKKDMGFELSTSVNYSFNERFSWFNQVNLVLPGNAAKAVWPKNSLGFYSVIAINF